MNNSIKVLAQQTASNGIGLTYVDNSVVTLGGNKMITEKVSNMMAVEVSIYRNNYLPLVREYTDDITELVTNLPVQTVSSPMDIKYVELPMLLQEYIDKQLFKVVSEPSRSIPTSVLTIPTPEPEMIRSYARAESPITQKYINELLAEMSDDQLVDMWDKYLLYVSGTNDNIDTISYNSTLNINMLTLLFAIVRNIVTVVPDKVNINLSDYTKMMRAYEGKLMVVLSNAAFYITKRMPELNILVERMTDDCVYVNRTLATKYLKDHRIEGLLGLSYVAASKRSLKYDEVVDLKDKAIDAYSKSIKVAKMAATASQLDSVKLAYSMAVDKLYTDMSSNTAEFIKVPLEQAKKDVAEYVKVLDPASLNDLKATSMDIVSNFIIRNGNFTNFTKNLVMYSKLDADMSPEDAATYATLDLIVDYVASQILPIG